MRPTRLPLAIALLAALPATNAQDAPPTTVPAVTIVHCGHLFDSDAGTLLGETTIITDGKRIKDVKPGRADAPGARRSSSATRPACPA